MIERKVVVHRVDAASESRMNLDGGLLAFLLDSGALIHR